MFISFLKTTVRGLWRNKTYSALNMFGLAIGIACAGLIFLWMEDEINFDGHQAKKDQLYRILEHQTYDGKKRTFWSTPMQLSDEVRTQVPGVVNTARVSGSRPTLFALGDKTIFERGGFVDPSFLTMLSWTFTEGNPQQAFKELHAIVISEKMAGQFFGRTTSIVGQTLRLDNKQEYVISGVVKDLPKNSTIQMDWMAPFAIYQEENKERFASWGANSIGTLVELEAKADVQRANQVLGGMIKKHLPESSTTPFLFSMNDWRLRDEFEDGQQTGGRITYVRLFTVIAWIVLLIACINFMNLATARSEKRAREVGVRKVLGAGKQRLVVRFIGESVFMALLSVAIAVLIIMLALPAFNLLVEKQLTIGLDKPLHIGALLSIALICGLVAGSYPALYLSSFNPIFVFKGIRLKSSSAAFIRKGLVVTQFTVSIVLIICTIIIYQQVQHVQARDMGYDRNNLLVIDARGQMAKNFTSIRNELVKSGAVSHVALNSYDLINIGNNTSNFTWQGKDPSQSILVSARGVSEDFIATAGMHIVEGRDFQVNTVADSSNVLVTESMAKLMGAGSAVGKTLQYNGGGSSMQVVGVVKDFIYGDMYAKSDPVVFFLNDDIARTMYVRISEKMSLEPALAKIGAVLKQQNPGYPFEYKFVDEQFRDKINGELLIGKLSRVFAALAIIISCLGLFGLTAYTAERRTREIGIRKVLGASVAGITHLLSKEFLQLVILSAGISFPIAWWAMQQWLNSYSYRVSIQWWVFLVAGVLAIVIALVTISLQSVKAALMNPVKSLRSE